jgi:palmitoyltransferase
MCTFPHFLRFLVFTNVSLWYLAWQLGQRIMAIWADRNLPAYLGPNLRVLGSMTVLTLVCAATMLALGIMLATTVRAWVMNMTMIEGWEQERHEAVLGRYDDGEYYYDNDGERVMIEPVEFPYDIGFFANMAQAMGTNNPLMWFFPIAGGPKIDPSGNGTGWTWRENGFNTREGMWPPVDPEKARRAARAAGWPAAAGSVQGDGYVFEEHATPEEAKAAFLMRQQDDFRRRQSQRSRIIAELEEGDDLGEVELQGAEYDFFEEGMDGEPGWTNADGDRLRDYGVDEEAENEELIPLDADDEVPIAELLRRRKVLSKEDDT